MPGFRQRLSGQSSHPGRATVSNPFADENLTASSYRCAEIGRVSGQPACQRSFQNLRAAKILLRLGVLRASRVMCEPDCMHNRPRRPRYSRTILLLVEPIVQLLK
jgi:heat shock protein HslJ